MKVRRNASGASHDSLPFDRRAPLPASTAWSLEAGAPRRPSGPSSAVHARRGGPPGCRRGVIEAGLLLSPSALRAGPLLQPPPFLFPLAARVAKQRRCRHDRHPENTEGTTRGGRLPPSGARPHELRPQGSVNNPASVFERATRYAIRAGPVARTPAPYTRSKRRTRSVRRRRPLAAGVQRSRHPRVSGLVTSYHQLRRRCIYFVRIAGRY